MATKIFISDLHLGDGSRADDFHRKDEFLNFLDNMRSEKNHKLIIAGDLFELWQADLDRVIFFHDEIIKRLLFLSAQGRLIYLIGNHDHLPFVKYLQKELNVQLKFEDKELNIWAEHGNQYDIFNRYKDPRTTDKNIIGRTISYLMGLLERTIHPDIDEWAAEVLKMRNRITPSSGEYHKRGGNFSEYEKAAADLIDKGRRIVIFGHTHQPVLRKLGNGIYANCGCWCGKETPAYIKVDSEKIELVNGISHSIINSLEL